MAAEVVVAAAAVVVVVVVGVVGVESGTLLRRQRSICTLRFLSPRWEGAVACSLRPNGTRV